jgi:hypothetical protein
MRYLEGSAPLVEATTAWLSPQDPDRRSRPRGADSTAFPPEGERRHLVPSQVAAVCVAQNRPPPSQKSVCCTDADHRWEEHNSEVWRVDRHGAGVGPSSM